MEKQATFTSSIEVADQADPPPPTATPPAEQADLAAELVSLLRLAQQISIDASQALTTEAVLLTVLERIASYSRWPVGHVWLQTAENGFLQSTGIWHGSGNRAVDAFREASEETAVGVDEGLVGAAVREGRAVWWTGLQEHRDFLRREAAAQVGIRTGFAFPAFYSGRLVAVFEFFSLDDREPSAAFLEVMAQIGMLVGNVFERRRTEANLAWNETLLRRMTDASRLGFFVVEREGRNTLYLNARFREIWGLPPEAAEEPWSFDRVASFCRSQLLDNEDVVLFPPEDELRHEDEIPLRDGRTLRTVSAPVGGDERVPLGRMYAHEDITRRKHAEQKFRDLLESAPDGMVIIGHDGRIVRVNAEAERMFGYDRRDLVGKRIDVLVPVEGQQPQGSLLSGLLSAPRTPQRRTGLDLLARRCNGQNFPAEVSLNPLTTEVGILTIAAIRDITRRKELERQLSEAVWQEQQALGRELHDGVGGALTGLTMISRSLQEKLVAVDPVLAQKAQEITECARSALLATKDLANGMVPIQIEQRGFLAALEELATNTTKRSGIACSFDRHTSMEIRDLVLATHLFRIVQEAVTNAVRHGRCSHVRIVLHTDRHRLLLKVEDDGRGLQQGKRNAGLGMHTMQHRADLVRGTLRIRNRGGRPGTSVTCLVKGWLGDVDGNGAGAEKNGNGPGTEKKWRHAGAGGR